MSFIIAFEKRANFLKQIADLPSRVNLSGASRKMGVTAGALKKMVVAPAVKEIPMPAAKKMLTLPGHTLPSERVPIPKVPSGAPVAAPAKTTLAPSKFLRDESK